VISRVRAVFFDAGATLLHADPPVEEIYVREFSRDGTAFSPEGIRRALLETWREVKEKTFTDRYGGVSGERAFWKAFTDRARFHLDGGSVSAACFDSLVRHFLDPRSWAVYPDAPPTLRALRARGLPLAVVSNWDSSLPDLLSAHGLTEMFAALFVSAREGTGKPAPEIFARACRRLSVSPAEALHVGDSPEEDFHAARAAGLTAVLLDREGRHPRIEPRVSSLSQIEALLPDVAPAGAAGGK
jgi:putative hydrolase of the HAD superfamily